MSGERTLSNNLVPLFGTGLMLLAAAIAVLSVVDRGEPLPFMPVSWYANRSLWYLMAMMCFAGGWALLRQSSEDEPLPKREPSPPAFQSVVFYTRATCPLCDEARGVLNVFAADLPPVQTIDVDDDPDLIERFGECVPAVEIDGKLRFRGRINPTLLRRLIVAARERERGTAAAS